MKNKTQLIIVILIVLSSGLSGIFGSIATSFVPESWREYTWVAWLLFIISLLVLVILTIWQFVIQNRESQQKENIDEYHELLEVANQIEKQATNILIENQKILSPIFEDQPSRKEIEKGIRKLFEVQHSRAKFGEWVSYLKNKEDSFKKEEIKKEIRNLRHILTNLQSILYENDQKYPTRYTLMNYTKKYMMKNVIGNQQIDIKPVRQATNAYLENLRKINEEIGKSKGTLKALRR